MPQNFRYFVLTLVVIFIITSRILVVLLQFSTKRGIFIKKEKEKEREIMMVIIIILLLLLNYFENFRSRFACIPSYSPFFLSHELDALVASGSPISSNQLFTSVHPPLGSGQRRSSYLHLCLCSFCSKLVDPSPSYRILSFTFCVASSPPPSFFGPFFVLEFSFPGQVS